MAKLLAKSLRRATDRGASLLEYAILVAVISLVVLMGVRAVGVEAAAHFDTVGKAMGAVDNREPPPTPVATVPPVATVIE